MSERQKREVADELVMQPSAFGVLFIAAILLLIAFIWSPFFDLVNGGGTFPGNKKEVISLLR